MPEQVEFLESGCVRKKKVAAVGEYRGDGTVDLLSIAPGAEAFASCTKLSDCSERGFSKSLPSHKVNGGVNSRGEPVAKPPHSLRGWKEHVVDHHEAKATSERSFRVLQ